MSNPRLLEIVESALARRSDLLREENNLVRLLDGAGDGLPGHYLEQYGPAWLISTSSPQLRPDLREILATFGKPLYWKRLDQHQKESPTHLSGPKTPEFFTGHENGLKCRLSFQSGYSQGIFIDQRDNRAGLARRIQPGQTLLNTFAYTGFFSVAAAHSGAITSTLDLSQVYLNWARENLRLNNQNPEDHYFCKGDTFHWLRRFAKQGRRFDYLILDPPTFSRDDKGKVFRVEKDYGRLFELALACTAKNGTILACTNFRGLSTEAFASDLKQHAPRSSKVTTSAMPPDFTDTPYLKSAWIDLQ